MDESGALDLKPLSDEIWETPVLESFKPSSLAKFDRHNILYEHMAFINS